VRTSFPLPGSVSPDAWAALSDPTVLAAALPGCRSAVPVNGADGGLQLVVDVAVASVRGLWAGTVSRVDADAVRVVGSGEPGRVDVVVRADPSRTTVTVEGTVEGPLGAIGSALLAAAVRRTVLSLLASEAAREQRQNEGGGA
jgi:carbon monoxide dehydrogenase subunit G